MSLCLRQAGRVSPATPAEGAVPSRLHSAAIDAAQSQRRDTKGRIPGPAGQLRKFPSKQDIYDLYELARGENELDTAFQSRAYSPPGLPAPRK